MELYRHAQIGKMIIGLFGLVELFSIGVIIFVLVSEEMSPQPILMGFVIVLGLLIILFYQLTVIVSEKKLEISFGIGLIKKAWRIDEIAKAVSVQNKGWYGFGIRLTSHGWLYNIEGLKAVEIEMKNSRRFRIGTDEPDGLIRAIEQAKQSQ
jgi:hypothetical protein